MTDDILQGFLKWLLSQDPLLFIIIFLLVRAERNGQRVHGGVDVHLALNEGDAEDSKEVLS